jgi:phospholipase C
MYLHSAQTDRIDNTFNLTSIPTIWDSLAAAGVSHTYYFNDLPFVGLWGAKYLGISRPWVSFLADAALGALPAVSFVEPPLGLEAVDGIGRDDHPHADIRNGEQFMNSVYRAITTSPNWSRTALVFTYDEWGGFYDHVAPTAAPDTNPSLTGLRGFRVPCLVISPRAVRGMVGHGLYDHTSILKMIEWRWGLPALTARDGAANNLAEVLDFTSPATTAAPQWEVDPVLALPCALVGTQPLGLGAMAPPLSASMLGGIPRSAAMQGLRQQALANGFHVAA